MARRPDAIALTCDGQSLTYGQLNRQANRVAHELVKSGVGPDTLVGLCMERTSELVVALLAIVKAGGAYLPIDLAYPADRLAFMLEDAQAPVLLTQTRLVKDLPPTHARVLAVDEILARQAVAEDETDLPSSSGPDNLAYVIYTSGTTGKPKGSLITHRNVARLFTSTERWFGFNESDVWTLFHSSAFDFSVWEIWGALLYGGRVVVVPFLVSRSPEAFYELLASERVTVLNQTPSAFRQLIQAEEAVGQKDLALRYVVFGGEALEMQSLRPWFERHGDQAPQLVNMYGITETTVHVTYRPLSKNDLASGSVIGVPIPDLRIYILDSQRRPAPLGVPGEIYVGGAGLARGYLRRPELTEERFVPDHLTGQPGSRLYRTGDLARFLPNRDIEYLGRIDHQVKIRGFRIELGEIESVLCQHAAVREAAVLAREDAPGTKRLIAYLVTSDPQPEVSDLREHLKKKVPEYMVPAVFVFLKKLPLTPNGKLDTKALPVPEHRPELAVRYVPPQTPAEKTLAGIWSKVLRVEKVGVNDNFFELGGDSILSIQIISLARREGLELTPKLLFANQTVAELASVAGLAKQATLAVDDASGDVPLTPIQQWFFEQELAEPQHYNQAFLFEATEPLERNLLEGALRELSAHHDALRLRYARGAEGWRQSYAVSKESAPLYWMEIAGLGDAEQRQIVETEAASLEASLNLEQGPLWRAAYFDAGSNGPGRLLLVVHHLAVDGVSWRALLEDLETAYGQLKSGRTVQLPAKTTSFKSWAERLQKLAAGATLHSELPYWKRIKSSPGSAAQASSDNTEGDARTLTSTLTPAETQTLLQSVPRAYNTQINDVLLTALARAWSRSNGGNALLADLEGHGRENLFDDVDLSRTVGWFTSIFPVRLELSDSGNDWTPGRALKFVKEQLRQIPQHGIGYGILRYLDASAGLAGHAESPILFNYLGQLDQIVAGSKLFRFAQDSTGPWHSPQQRRRYALEANSLVIDGRLEIRWTFSPQLHSETTVEQLANEFLFALRELIVHCQAPNAGGRTPSDFPLANLDQPTVDRLFAEQPDVEDICPLSPMQALFHSANPEPAHFGFDQWQCTLSGDLNVAAFQQAWNETIQRHTILRSTFHAAGLREPLQVVHRTVAAPWKIEDWSAFPPDQRAQRWSELLKQDRAQPITLTDAPCMRFALARTAADSWKFLWSVPALLLDGWSWPLVFRDASQLYAASSMGRAAQLERARPYRDYLQWINAHSADGEQEFWSRNLAGFREPTLLPTETPSAVQDSERYPAASFELPEATTKELHAVARRLQITVNTLIQGAWALLLSRQSGTSDVVFGAAFSGRPAELAGSDSIVGPLTNNLPVRVSVEPDITASELLKKVHSHSLALTPFQSTRLMDVQNWSEVPWRHRLFDSLVVFQNYAVDDSARGFGESVKIADFAGPIHTNYRVLLLIEPGTNLRVSLIYDGHNVARAAVERWSRDLRVLLDHIPVFLDRPLSDLQALLSFPVVQEPSVKRQKLQAVSQNFTPPQNDMERAIGSVWQIAFGLDRVSIEDNLFDLGGHSLLLVRLHSRLREVLKMEFPIVTLFQNPTIRALARHLSQGSEAAPSKDQFRDRALRNKQALAGLRTAVKR